MEGINREVKVKYYGMLSEKLGINEETLQLPHGNLNLREFITQIHPEIADFTFSTAVDLVYTEELAPEIHPQKIDIMPPFAGG